MSRAAVPVLLAACLLASGAALAGPTNAPSASDAGVLLQRLESRLGEVKTVQTAFRQEKELAILTQTLVIEGRIAMENPGRLAWHVDQPMRYSLVLSATDIVQWDEASGRVQRTALGANPILRVVAEQLRKWVSGQYASLTNTYAVRLAGEQPYVIEFTPRAEGAAKAVRRVTVEFRDDERYVQRIAIEEPGGDRTTLTFAETVLNAPIAASAWEVEPGRDRP
jgi:outer membrane lipoprotein-sorting protein